MEIGYTEARYRDDIAIVSDYGATIGASPAPVPRSLDLRGLIPLVETATLALGTCAAQAAEMPGSTGWIDLLLCRETAIAARANRLNVTVADVLIERCCCPCPTQVRGWLRLPMNFRRAIGVAIADARSHRRAAFGTTEILALHRHCADGLVDLAPGDSFRTRETRTSGAARPAQARFVPPSPGRIGACMDDLIAFLAQPGRGTEALPLVARMAIVASQITAIQPFSVTGTDLLQRILVPMMAAAEGLPPVPIGGAMHDHGRSYAQNQIEPHVSGDWSSWIAVFLAGYVEAIHETRVFMAGLRALTASWGRAVAGLRSDSAVHRIVASLPACPVLAIPTLQRSLGLSYQRANCAVALLVDKGIVSLTSDTRRNRLFIAHDLAALLERRGAR